MVRPDVVFCAEVICGALKPFWLVLFPLSYSLKNSMSNVDRPQVHPGHSNFPPNISCPYLFYLASGKKLNSGEDLIFSALKIAYLYQLLK